MSVPLAEVEKLVSSFRSASSVENPDLKQCQEYLTKLKLNLIHFNLVPPFKTDMNVARKELLLARETFELAVYLAVRQKDVNAFERYVAQLKPFYFDYGQVLPESERKWPILGLELLGLLALHPTAAFHTELEFIPVAVQEDNIYIKFPIQLEQALMEGCYNKVLSARKFIPLPHYSFFMDMLNETVRNKISDCVEASYQSLPVADACKLLMIDSQDKLRQHVEQRGWRIEGSSVTFNKGGETQQDIPATKMVQYALEYATELEKII